MKIQSFTLIIVVSTSTAASIISDSPITCTSNQTACDNHEDNVLDKIGNVQTLEECRQLCYDNQDCDFLTYYGDQSFPLRHLCILLSSCDQTHDCSDCVSETRDCFFTCADHVVGLMEDNIIDLHFDVESEHDCRNLCSVGESCSFYTYFTEDDPNSRTCVLLTHLIEPLQPCATCMTGPVDCSDDCKMIIDGESYTSMMFTNAGDDVNVDVSGDCVKSQLRLLLVGGGGRGDYGGGGSGYIQYQTLGLAGVTNISLNVGNHGESSKVNLNGQTIVAEPGDDSIMMMKMRMVSITGGDGYSGGTGYCNVATSCRGGSNGGDGDNGEYGDDGATTGGHGTGEDITNYNLDNWVLTPGSGGDGTVPCGSAAYGGGGGGVLVNGEGPHQEAQDGEGYGGGGGACSQPGVILIEIVS